MKRLVIRCLVAAVAIAAWPAMAAADWCEGKDPIEHNDGNYRFTTESWVRNKDNGWFYGRCIKVLDPTTALRNTWVGVLPTGAVARTGAPTTGGQTFIDNQSEHGAADLYYGNADNILPKEAYYAHRDEEPQDDDEETIDASLREKIDAAIEELKAATLESVFSFAFLLNDDNPASLMDMDLHFSSSFDGQRFRYVVSYALTPASEEFSAATLSFAFPSEALTAALRRSTDRDIVPVAVGKDVARFEIEASGQGDFAQHKMRILNADGKLVSEIPINYLLPAR